VDLFARRAVSEQLVGELGDQIVGTRNEDVPPAKHLVDPVSPSSIAVRGLPNRLHIMRVAVSWPQTGERIHGLRHNQCGEPPLLTTRNGLSSQLGAAVYSKEVGPVGSISGSSQGRTD
jgi:hypothetical protein